MFIYCWLLCNDSLHLHKSKTKLTELSLSELVDLLLALVHLFGIGGAGNGDGGCRTTGEGHSTTASGALVYITLPPLVHLFGIAPCPTGGSADATCSGALVCIPLPLLVHLLGITPCPTGGSADATHSCALT